MTAPIRAEIKCHAAGVAWASWFHGLNAARAIQTRQEGLVRAKHYVDRQFSDALRLDAMAEEARLSRYHFLRAFRHLVSQTPHRYLIDRRIACARELLERTEMSVTHIALEVGFDSLGSFITRFHRLVGEPPGRYRKRFTRDGALEERAIPMCFFRAWGSTGGVNSSTGSNRNMGDAREISRRDLSRVHH